MKVLFVSGELIAGDLCYRLKKEGCDVKLYIEDESRKDCFDGMVEKTDDWKKELKWVGKDGLIVFDDVGYGQEQDELRKKGYNVFGGSLGGDRLEKNREFAQLVLLSHGIIPLKTYNFKNIQKAIDFVSKNNCSWVVKQNNHTSSLTYVGVMKDGSDVLELLRSYEGSLGEENAHISLQKKVDGIEIAVARYFNGEDWVGPIEVNIEHKRLFNGDIGPMTGEMGTLAWYDSNEKNKLFQATLSKLKPHLQKIDFRGDIDINCIVDKDNVYPLEVTARLGCPSTHMQTEIHLSPWKEFLFAASKKQHYNLKYKKGYGIVVSVAIPPFPYRGIDKEFYSKGVSIFFKGKLSDEEARRIHLEEVCLKENNGKEHFCVAGSNGFILYVTGVGKSVEKARERAYKLVDKIIIPKMFYRTDIGMNFIKKDRELLKEWGWLQV